MTYLVLEFVLLFAIGLIVSLFVNRRGTREWVKAVEEKLKSENIAASAPAADVPQNVKETVETAPEPNVWIPLVVAIVLTLIPFFWWGKETPSKYNEIGGKVSLTLAHFVGIKEGRQLDLTSGKPIAHWWIRKDNKKQWTFPAITGCNPIAPSAANLRAFICKVKVGDEDRKCKLEIAEKAPVGKKYPCRLYIPPVTTAATRPAPR